MTKRTRVGIIFGGKSAEHEVSLQSAQNIIGAIDKEKYEPVPICIARSGEWYLGDADRFLATQDSLSVRLNLADDEHNSVNLITGERYGQLVRARTHEQIRHIDVYFPVLHGPMGEDGTIQGLLKLANVPFVGSSVLGSAIGMDKDVMKRLLRDAGIRVAKFITLNRFDRATAKYNMVVAEVGLPFFVKPVNMGSSVGVHKVASETEFEEALDDAFQYDHKVLCEEFVQGREIECSVLGNEEPTASQLGEIRMTDEAAVEEGFYSYEAKYTDDTAAELLIPAELDPKLAAEVRSVAIRTFQICCCEGMARVDFFVRGNEILVNEINTIPGFTQISMYPKLWEASGLAYPQLIDRLIELAIERYDRDQLLKISV